MVTLILLSALLLAGCGNTNEEVSQLNEGNELEDVTFVLDWTPNTNHTGIYVAE